MLSQNNNRLSLYTLLFLFLAILCLGIIPFYSKLEYLRFVISWDVFGYYLYLPAAFIHHDLTLEHFDWVVQVQKQYEVSDTLYQLFNTPHDGQNTWVIKYAMGSAVLFSPFFFISHMLAPVFGYPADGFSLPYQIGILTAGYFYTLCGLLLVRKVLLNFFSDKITAIVLFILVAGTNYMEYTAQEGVALSHPLLFFINAMILYLTIRWHKNPKYHFALLLGAFIALAAITRPFEIVWLLVPLFWGIGGTPSLKAKIELLKQHFLHLPVFAFGMLLIGGMQMLYWKAATGHYLHFTYTEEFFFTKPFILQVLFSYKKGWLLYTPVMIFALAGFVFIYKKQREYFLSTFLCFLLYLWLVSSFEGWWYSSSFSNRALLETYALLVIPLGFFIQTTLQQKRILRKIISVVLSLFVTLNLFQTWQYTQGIIDKERMTKEYYWAVFLKTYVDEETRELLEVDRLAGPPKSLESGKRFSGKVLSESDFDQAPADNIKRFIDSTLFVSRPHSLLMDSVLQFAATFETQYANITNKEYAWIKASASFYYSNPEEVKNMMIVTNFKHNGEIYEYKATALKSDSLKIGQWNRLAVYYLTPIVKSPTDTLQVYAWYNGKGRVWMDDFRVEAYEPK